MSGSGNGSAGRSVIVAGARTPIGKFGGALCRFPAVDLGGIAIRAALERSGLSGPDVGCVIMGQTLQGGAGQIMAGRRPSPPASPRRCRR
jgi:acetyl-CoA C-acetyltransferase